MKQARQIELIIGATALLHVQALLQALLRQPPTIPPSSHLYYHHQEIADKNLLTPRGWIAGLARACVYAHDLLSVIT